MGIICTLIVIVSHDFDIYIYKKMYIDLCMLSAFCYMISFVGLISKAKNKIDIYNIIIFSIASIYLLYKANAITLMYIIGCIYLILTFFKLQILPKTRNRKILKSIWCIGLITFMLNISFYQLERMPYREVRDYTHLQERVTNSKMIGRAELSNDLQEDAYTQYVYLNFSENSFEYLVENYGKICGIFILGIFMFLLIKLIFNYKQTKDVYGKLLSIGIGCFLFIPMIVDLLTRVGLADFIRVNIPFITHNDISIIIYMMCISLIMSIYSRKNINITLSEKVQNKSII